MATGRFKADMARLALSVVVAAMCAPLLAAGAVPPTGTAATAVTRRLSYREVQTTGRLLSPSKVAPADIAEIAHATFVDLEVYELGNPAVIAALIAAHRRSVDVRVILDATEGQSQAAARVLAHAGVDVEKMRVAGGIDHVKLLVSNLGVVMGGVNLGRYSGDTTDVDVELGRSDVAPASRLFAADWSAGGNGDKAASGTLGPFVTGTAVEASILGAVRTARGRCVVVANYLSDYEIEDALVAALRRGVAVDVLLNRSAYGAAEAATVLARAGAHVSFARPDPYLHAKVLACGSSVVFGSANFSYDAMRYNHELDLVAGGVLARDLTAWAARAFSSAA